MNTGHPPWPEALPALLDELARAPPVQAATGWDPALRPGHQLGRYRLGRELSRDRFRLVFEARDEVLGRPVALKLLRAGPITGVARRVRHEAATIADLSHPNLAALLDAGRSEHGPFLVYELLDGARLSERLSTEPVAPAESLRIALAVGRALAVAHARGVAHHDLTPEQVFLCDDGSVKVLDLAVAHTFGSPRLEGGALGYAAPEQWRGAPEDERTDVFALGVLLYRLLTGRLPFPEDGGRSATDPSSAPAIELAEWPGLGGLVGRMLATDPVERPRDGAAVVAALEALQADTSASGASVRIRRRARRLRSRAALLVGLALAAVVVTGAVLLGGRPAAADARPSVAVVPFADLSERGDQAAFSDGLSEEITSALAQVDGLRVAGRTSAFSFRDRLDDLRSLGRQLGVTNVLLGSVRRDPSRVRVTARLVRTGDGHLLWSQTFERSLTGVFAVQDEIAGAVVAALEVELLPGRKPTSKEFRTANPEVYGQYLQGRRLSRHDTVATSRLAAASFQRALDLEPGYAPAWAGLAKATYYGWGNVSDSASDLEAAKSRAEAAAERAVALAPGLAEAYEARAFLRVSLRQDWAGGRADMERALALNPGDPGVMWSFARTVLGPTGRFEEAVTLARRASQLDPLSNAPWSTLAALYLALDRLELARSAALRSLELEAEQDSAPVYLATAELLERRPEAALAAARRSVEKLFHLQFEVVAYHDLHRPGDSDAALARLVATHAADAPFQIACAHAWRGEPDLAFEWLERAVAQRDGGLADLRMEPLLRSLRGDPRFKALERRLGLAAD